MEKNEHFYEQIKLPEKNKRTYQKNKKYRSYSGAGYSFDNFLSDAGNKSIQQLFNPVLLQTKLKLSQPGDPYEQEADRTAEAIVSDNFTVNQVYNEKKVPVLHSNPVDFSGMNTDAIINHFRKVQAKTMSPLSNEINSAFRQQQRITEVRRKNTPGEESVSPQLEAKINALQGRGQPLDSKARDYFQPRFGADFKDVRIHTDSNADNLAHALQAKAFAYKNNVVFAKGTYRPGSREGKKLIAHELTHVLQQNYGIQTKSTPTISGNIYKHDVPDYLFHAIKNDKDANIILFNNEIRSFNKENSSLSIQRKQEKIFATQKPVQVKLKDNSETMRRWTSGSSPPKVTAIIGPVNFGTSVNRLAPTRTAVAGITISGTIPAGKHIDIDIEGSGGDNGVASITVGNQLTASGTVTVTAGTASQQTKPGYAGNLKIRASLDGVPIGHSAGFTIAAYPQNYKDALQSDINSGGVVGLVVSDNWESDGTGNISDLDEVEISELVGLKSQDNPPFTSGGGTSTTSGTSGYLAGNQTSTDRHGYPKALINTSTLAHDATKQYSIVYTQLCLFKCKRTNIIDQEMPASGYEITHSVWWDALTGTTGAWKHKTTKAGAAVTIGSYSVTAGSITGTACSSSVHAL